MRYFITQDELDAKNKSALGVALFAIFLGGLGVHRFYVNRTLSGVIIILVNIVTLGLGLIVTVPIVLSEFIYYIYLAIRQHQSSEETTKLSSGFKEQLSSINQKFKEEMQLNNAQFQESLHTTPKPLKNEASAVTDRPNIVEVSNVVSELIKQPIIPSGSTNWIRLLEIPYERQSMQVPQIKRETLRLYEAICKIVDEELQRGGKTLLGLKQELDSSGEYYSNILYTFYCIAEGEVEHHYSGSGYNNTFSYDILRRHTNEEFVNFIDEFCAKYIESLPIADEDTRAAYHLTERGLRSTWWDEDGSIRTKHSLTPAQVRLLDRTPSRSTVVLKIPEIRLLVLAQYLSTMSVLHKHFRDPSEWSPKTAAYLNYLFGKRSNYNINDWATARIAQYTLKLCEQTIRQNIPYMHLLKTDMEVSDIKLIAPKAAAAAILDRAGRPVNPINLSKDTVEALRELNPQAWKRDIKALVELSPNECLHILQWYRGDSEFTSIARQAIKHTVDKQIVCLISCYVYFASIDEEEVEKDITKILHSIVMHPLQQKRFMELTRRDVIFDDTLIKQLEALMEAPVRTIELDASKVQAARTAHEDALKQVSGYLGEDNDTELEIITSTKPQETIILEDLFGGEPDESDLDLSTDQLDFLRLVMKADFNLDVQSAESFVRTRHKLLGSMMQGINQQYYEVLEDQLLCTVNDKITIEEIYRKQVKETLSDHNPA
jgi:TM2 domain-containing membrane protein YozV